MEKQISHGKEMENLESSGTKIVMKGRMSVLTQVLQGNRPWTLEDELQRVLFFFTVFKSSIYYFSEGSKILVSFWSCVVAVKAIIQTASCQSVS